jgi:hypothetical protein
MWLVVTLEAAPLIGFELAATMLIIGALLLTGPEGYEPADRADFWRRLLLRIASIMPLLALLIQHVILGSQYWLTITPRRPYIPMRQSSWWVVVPLLLTVGCVPLPILLYYQLRSLAKRARSAHLAEHCAIVGTGTSLALLYVAATLFMFETARRWSRDPYWTSRSNGSLLLALILSVAAALFVLWSLYLLIRFAIAFHLAARRLKSTWRRDDRALHRAS